METRKVQKVSTGTFIISLPKSWTSRNNVKKGSAVSMTESPTGSLLLTHARETPGPSPISLHDDGILEETIIACYTMGAQRISVTIVTPSVRARVLKVIQYLPGFEVTQDDDKRIAVSCLLDEGTVRFYQLVERLCALLEYGVSAAVEGDAGALRQNEQEIDRSFHLCQRILARAAQDPGFLDQTGLPSLRTIPSFQLLVKRIEHCGDALMDLPPKMTAQQQQVLRSLVANVVLRLRLLAAGRLTTAKLIRDDLPKSDLPALMFLRKTAEDIREELIQLHVGMTLQR